MGTLFHTEPSEKPQLDNLGLPGIDARESAERVIEPHDVRTDHIEGGEFDVTKVGLPRAYDAKPETPTHRFERGDDRNPDTSKVIAPAVPRALGGKSTPENVRLLCRLHNDVAARRTFGDEWMNQFSGQAPRALPPSPADGVSYRQVAR